MSVNDPGTMVLYHESTAEVARYAEPTATGRIATRWNPATRTIVTVRYPSDAPTWQQLGLSVTGPGGLAVPVASYRSSARYDLEAGRAGRAIRSGTIRAALAELVAAELVAGVGVDPEQRWVALPTTPDPLLVGVDLHGAHDFRHTFATWLEDAGIPPRVIDEVMGHEASSRVSQQRGSAMGAHYRHTTPEMAARIAAAIEQRLKLVLEVAEQALEAQPNRSPHRMF